MDPRLQLRVQRYGWDLAADDYEPAWSRHLAATHAAVLDMAALRPGDRVLDVACGPGRVTLEIAARVGPAGHVVGIDLSGRMIDRAIDEAAARATAATFRRMDAQALAFDDGAFDVVVCSLGLMYLPDPERCLAEAARVLREGGRLVVAVWGDPAQCGWSAVFGLVDAEVASDVCPLFFRLGADAALRHALGCASFGSIALRRLPATFVHRDADDACLAAFEGGPLALAWSRFDDATKARVRDRYLASIDRCRSGSGYAVPGEFVIVSAVRGAISGPARDAAMPATAPPTACSPAC